MKTVILGSNSNEQELGWDQEIEQEKTERHEYVIELVTAVSD